MKRKQSNEVKELPDHCKICDLRYFNIKGLKKHINYLNGTLKFKFLYLKKIMSK